jgi:hypothetical protein
VLLTFPHADVLHPILHLLAELFPCLSYLVSGVVKECGPERQFELALEKVDLGAMSDENDGVSMMLQGHILPHSRSPRFVLLLIHCRQSLVL